MALPFIEKGKLILVTPAVTPSSYTPKFLSLKGYERATFFLYVATGSSGVTAIAASLLQATVVAGSDAKVLPFTEAFRKLDVGAADQELTKFTVASNTFTFDATVSKNNIYQIEVDKSQLDIKNDFDCLALDFADGAAQTVLAMAVLHPSKNARVPTNPLVD